MGMSDKRRALHLHRIACKVNGGGERARFVPQSFYRAGAGRELGGVPHVADNVSGRRAPKLNN